MLVPPHLFSSAIFFFQAEDGIRDLYVTGVQTCALPIWRNAVLDVVGELCFAAAVHLAQRAFHRAGDAIGVQNRLAAEVARRASDGLDQRAIRSQEALLVGIEHRESE